MVVMATLARLFGKLHARPPFLAALLAAALIAIAAGTYAAGYRAGVENPRTVTVAGIANMAGDAGTADFSLFWEVWQRLRDEHLHGEEVGNQELVYSAIEGLVAALDDPNTVFFRPEDSKKFEEDISGSFGGIGAEIGIKNDQLVVVAPIAGSPADRAGLKASDRIQKIDQAATDGLAVNDAVKKIRGPIGTTVVLTIMRASWSAPRDVPITRETIVVPTVEWKFVGDRIMHVKLHSFNELAPSAFQEAALAALVGNARGMVLDLRNDPGGFLEVAVDIAGWFLDKGEVVAIEHYRSQPDEILRSRGSGALKYLPLVILVDEGSASASEILAGALKDNRSIPIVGMQTFGKGTVQQLQPLRFGTKLKITIADWLRPSRIPLEKKGITPDYEVRITDDDVLAARDPQLDKALEILQLEIGKSAK